MCDVCRISPEHFLLLMCAALFISVYGSQGSVGPFSRVRHLSGNFYSMSGYNQNVVRNRYVLLTSTFKNITNAGSMMRFPIHKGYYGKPTHHTGVSNLKWLLISKLLNP